MPVSTSVSSFCFSPITRALLQPGLSPAQTEMLCTVTRGLALLPHAHNRSLLSRHCVSWPATLFTLSNIKARNLTSHITLWFIGISWLS